MSKSNAKAPRHLILDKESWEAIAREFRLTPRELDIVKLIFDGEGEAGVARRLGISIHTVHANMRYIYLKTGASDHLELALLVLSTYNNLAEDTR